MTPGIRLRPISHEAAEALAAGRPPDDVRVAHDHPTELSAELAMGGSGTPLDRLASGRMLEQAGFTLVGEEDDEHDGVPMRVRRFELELEV